MCIQLPHIATLEICIFYDNDNDDDDDGFFRPEIITESYKILSTFLETSF